MKELGDRMHCSYEMNRLPYFFALPLMWIITLHVALKKSIGIKTGINHFFVDGLGRAFRSIKEGAASWRAVHIVYHYQFGNNKTLGGNIDDFWIGMRNAQAVRNRFKLVKQIVGRAIIQFERDPEIRIVSLACGSAEAMIEVVSECEMRNIRVSLLLIDQDQEALEYAKQYAMKYQVLHLVRFERRDVFRAKKIVAGFKPHIVEMLGLLDYLNDRRAIWLIDNIEEILADKGVFFTCNIRQNLEMWFLHWVANWRMVYRSSDQFFQLMQATKFKNFSLVYEPLGIHGIVEARKGN